MIVAAQGRACCPYITAELTGRCCDIIAVPEITSSLDLDDFCIDIIRDRRDVGFHLGYALCSPLLLLAPS